MLSVLPVLRGHHLCSVLLEVPLQTEVTPGSSGEMTQHMAK